MGIVGEGSGLKSSSSIDLTEPVVKALANGLQP